MLEVFVIYCKFNVSEEKFGFFFLVFFFIINWYWFDYFGVGLLVGYSIIISEVFLLFLILLE